ncbi:sensor histidine kinase [Mumia qirimensis]|uniref:sensor histidine kinase n=1 Tax=Mumia qirimensis TaxID=3234852 RepID=UPI00351D9897
MWSLRRPRATLAGQFLVLQLCVVAVVLAVVAIISVRQSTTDFRELRGSRLQAAAEYVANPPVVRSEASTPGAPRRLAPAIQQAANLSGSDTVSLVAPDGDVLASTDPRLVGTTESAATPAFDGRAWTGDVDDPDGTRIVGQAPVISDDGRLVAVVTAEDTYPSVWRRLSSAAPDLVLYLGVGALLGIAGSWLLSRLIRRRTHGLEPAEIATLADHREALLHSIRDGVVAVGTDGRITVLNDSACALLGLEPRDVGRPVDDVGLPPDVARVLAGAAVDRTDTALVLGDRVLVVNQRHAASGGEGIGTVSTLRDRTDVVALQSQLGTALSLTDTLRAQTHEFSNQLHTISGLVQLGEYAEVDRFIGTVSERRTEVADTVTAHVDDPAVAALLIGKTSRAAEVGVTLRIVPGSVLPVLEPRSSADLVTILGNLVDNATDAARGTPAATVAVTLTTTGDRLHVEVRDNGPGVPDALHDAIFVRGFSTKPAELGGRGIGLPLVRLICSERGGEVRVEDQDGAVFVVDLPVREAVGHGA